jgi:hypothetical protein
VKRDIALFLSLKYKDVGGALCGRCRNVVVWTVPGKETSHLIEEVGEYGGELPSWWRDLQKQATA